MTRPGRFVAVLLFVSGFCALVFQTAWLREFRLIFGASTAASAAVLAIFMGGLGWGNAVLGRRTDLTAAPLRLYAWLELSISVYALASPLLVHLVRSAYLSVGGQETIGSIPATLVRISLAAIVLGGVTFLMGGTLPAAVKAALSQDDVHRQHVGSLYGCNTLGAVAGALLSTFVLLEWLGNRQTLFLAAAINVCNACLAFWLSRYALRESPRLSLPKPRGRKLANPPASQQSPETTAVAAVPPAAAPQLIYAAAAIVGFAFFLMELVWYRMLAAILGGTTFTFGLILAVALAGIGIGGALFPLIYRQRVPTPRDLALSCAWEALAIAFPFALGDQLALAAYGLQGLTILGFPGQVVGWALVAMVVVFPAALVSGVQFPLLVSLLGQGREQVGRQLGLTFMWNTVGAVLGSLSGGFGLVPLLSAPGTWKFSVILLVLLAIALLISSFLRQRQPVALLQPLAVLVVSVICLSALGPTAVWRHSAIGAGRARLPAADRNELQAWKNDRRRHVVWQGDGPEAGVGIVASSAVAFLVNGKSDGNAVTDAATQIMFSTLGAWLHPDPQESLVIGLGTGESAGWLAAVPTMRHVDVVELEPVISTVAGACAPLNHNVLRHPKVRVMYNDAREFVQTTRRQYDVIASEPSNPYRAGVSSLYTLDFYRHAALRLKRGGVFVQWLQAYEVDVPTVQMVLATLNSVFPHVEIWETEPGDLVLICSSDTLQYDLPHLKSRLQVETYREALRVGWRTNTAEGLLAHFVANAHFVNKVATLPNVRLNTDDRNFLEYRFARAVGQRTGFSAVGLRQEARQLRLHRPTAISEQVDWNIVEDELVAFYAALEESPVAGSLFPGERGQRGAALMQVFAGNTALGLQQWEGQPKEPTSLIEIEALAFAYARAGQDKARPLMDRLRATCATDVLLLEAHLAYHQQRLPEAIAALEAGLTALKIDATVLPILVEQTCNLCGRLAEESPEYARRLYTALAEPFAVLQEDDRRRIVRCAIGQHVSSQAAVAAIEELEPHIPWTASFLRMRLRAYEETSHPRLVRARRDMLSFNRAAPEHQVASGQGK